MISLLGTRDKSRKPIVFEFGNFSLKMGFAGDSGPRLVIRSADFLKRIDCYLHVGADTEQLKLELLQYFHDVILRSLQVQLNNHQIVVVQAFGANAVWKYCISEVLLRNYEVPLLSFVSHSSAVSSLFLKASCLLSIDIGYKQTTVTSTIHGFTNFKSYQFSNCGVQTILGGLKEALSALEQNHSVQGVCLSLTDDQLNDILHRSSSCLSSSSPLLEYHLDGETVIFVSYSAVGQSLESLFSSDENEQSLAVLALDALLAAPLDFRTPLAKNILVHGGGAMIPGVGMRLHKEMVKLCEKRPYSQRISADFRYHKAPFPANYLPFVGASLMAAAGRLEPCTVSRSDFLENGLVPDPYLEDLGKDDNHSG